MYIFLSFLLSLSFIFSVPVYASDLSTEYSSNDYTYSLYDIFNDKSGGALDAFADWYDTSVDDMTNNVDTYIIKPLQTVQSSFMSCAQDTLDATTQFLKDDVDFMKSVFFDPISKILCWNEQTYKEGHRILNDYLSNSSSAPSGFYPCDYQHSWLSGYTFYWMQTDFSQTYFTYIPNRVIVFCSYNDAMPNVTAYMYSSVNTPTSATSGERSYSFVLNERDDSNTYYYSYQYMGGLGNDGNISTLYPPVYSTVLDALKAFYNNGSGDGRVRGYFRPLPKDKEFVATADNVINNNWGDIIVKNYTTYGDTFNNTTINNFYYTSTNPNTPNYWYDIYNDDTVSIPQHDYDDLTDVTLANPNIVANHNFITDVFGAIPLVISTLFISCLLLAIVIIFLKG